MKKFFAAVAMAIVTIFSANTVNAQMVEEVNLKEYAQAQYGKKWDQAALRAADQMEFDAEGNLTINKTIEAPGMSKEDLYYEMANWFISNYQNSIQLAEKEDGVIIACPYISNIATSASGWNAYKIDICPLVRVSVSDGLVNIAYTLKDYGVGEEFGGGNVSAGVTCGLLATAIAVDVCSSHDTKVIEHRHHGPHHTVIERTYVRRPNRALEDALLISCLANSGSKSRYDDNHTVWPVKNCYPFVEKDSHKKASARAFVMAATYSQVLVDNMEAAVMSNMVALK